MKKSELIEDIRREVRFERLAATMVFAYGAPVFELRAGKGVIESAGRRMKKLTLAGYDVSELETRLHEFLAGLSPRQLKAVRKFALGLKDKPEALQ
jgi:hypothetical protein